MKYGRKIIVFKCVRYIVYVDIEEMNFGKNFILKCLKYSLFVVDYLFFYGKNKNIFLWVGKL